MRTGANGHNTVKRLLPVGNVWWPGKFTCKGKRKTITLEHGKIQIKENSTFSRNLLSFLRLPASESQHGFYYFYHYLLLLGSNKESPFICNWWHTGWFKDWLLMTTPASILSQWRKTPQPTLPSLFKAYCSNPVVNRYSLSLPVITRCGSSAIQRTTDPVKYTTQTHLEHLG